MAGDWIKLRIDLQTHPKIVRILSATKSDKFRAIGGLHAVWSVFDTHSQDGILPGYSPETLDHIIGWPGFSAAMMSVGWLIYDGKESLQMPEFNEHNGKSGKRRAEDQKRKREERKCPQAVRNLSEPKADTKRTREEKRREDEESTNVDSKRKQKAAIDLSAWESKPSAGTMIDWAAMRKAKHAPLSQTVINKLAPEINLAVASGYTADDCLSLCILKGWQGFKFQWLKNEESNNANNQRNTGTNRSDRNTQAHRDYIADLERQAEIEAGRCLADSSEPALGY